MVEGRVECDVPARGRPWSRSPPLAVVDGDLKDHLEATLDPAAVAEPSPTGGTGVMSPGPENGPNFRYLHKIELIQLHGRSD